MAKLNQFKAASKNIKQKNQVNVHKIEWQKDYQKFKAKEFQLQNEIYNDLRALDTEWAEYIQDRGIQWVSDIFFV